MEQSFSSCLLPDSAPPPLRRVNEADPSAASFAFLVHSQDTIPRNLPPSVDNKPLARQRRRRTSPEDQAVLEAEFQRDSKPDKDARRRIVERVALGEKEVQIWFQNRRQNKRRKSQPPIAYEILPHLEPAPSSSPSSPRDGPLDSSPSQDAASSNERTEFSASTSFAVSSQGTASGEASVRDDIAQTLPQSCVTEERSSASPLEKDHTISGPQSTASTFNTATPTLERVASRVRLSMTSSGGAKIISGAETTPSPPRSQPTAHTPFATRQTLRRSYSSAGFREPHNIQNSFSGLLRRQPSGRSRDWRAWEFWCDSDARNGLVRKAEQEATGSAADAISLIRSNSARGRSGVLGLNHIRSNLAVLSRGEHGAKRVKKTHQDDWDVGVGRSKGKAKDAKLKRAMSSVARLQGLTYKRQETRIDTGRSLSCRSESDKENRAPDAGGLDHAGRGMQRHGRANRTILGESRTVPMLGNKSRHGLGIHVGGSQKYGQHVNHAMWAEFEGATDADAEEEEEIAQFMHGGGAGSETDESSGAAGTGASSSSAADEDDDEMDCVAGLLSLSQGNWR